MKRRKTHARAAKVRLYDLYQQSVQEPEADFRMIDRVFRQHFGRPARLLREDFCGTALMACRWVARHRENRAWAIDLDPRPLAWGRAHNLTALRPDQAARVKLIDASLFGAYGRLYLSGPEAQIDAAREAAVRALGNVQGKEATKGSGH